jgi:hypothetical protein
MKTLQINNNYQECDVVMLPTKNDSARIIKSEDRDYLVFVDKWSGKHIDNHLYILSNDEIKKGDWVLTPYHEIYQVVKFNGGVPVDKNGNGNLLHNKKIISTTDKSLRIHKSEILGKINGHTLGKVKSLLLPQLPQSFIEYFISEYNKGNLISKVLVEVENDYEEPQGDYFRIKLNQNNEISILTEQKQIFSREEVVEFLNQYRQFTWKNGSTLTDLQQWIQQNLK